MVKKSKCDTDPWFVVIVDQVSSLFLPADVHKKELHQIHFQAWKKGLKSLYYCRSKSIQRAENVNNGLSAETKKNNPEEDVNYEECLSCQ